jgi:hypothetical protein
MERRLGFPWLEQRLLRLGCKERPGAKQFNVAVAPLQVCDPPSSGYRLSLWRSSGEILNHGCKSLRSDFHRAGERIIDCHNGQQAGKD